MNNDLISREQIRKMLNEAFGCENATKYGNKNAEQQALSYSTLMLYEISNIVEDCCDNAPTVNTFTDDILEAYSKITDQEFEHSNGFWIITPKGKKIYFEKKRPQGEWECARIGNTNFITCSHCKEQFETENTLELWQDEYKFCHRCGAKMGGEEE